jgi:hypothetical protein
MTRNVGGGDRVVCWIVGIALLLLAFLVDLATGWRAVAFVIGAAAVLTAAFRFCPMNRAFGLDTYERDHSLAP